MAKIRYAILGPDGKPCCPCLKEANYVLWYAPLPEARNFKYKYQPGDKIKYDDFKARTYWMDAYIACIKTHGLDPKDYVTEQDPHIEPGTLTQACGTTMLRAKGDLFVIVQYEKENVADATVKVHGPEKKTLETGGNGVAEFRQLSPGVYHVEVWKPGYDNVKKGTGRIYVPPGGAAEVFIQLTDTGNLRVIVMEKDTQIRVKNADVTIWTTDGRYFPSKKTDYEGIARFNLIPCGKYWVEAMAGQYPTDRKQVWVGTFNDYEEVRLKVLKQKKFKIRVAKMTWWQFTPIKIPIPYIRPSIGINLMTFKFDVWDPKQSLKATYSSVVYGKVVEKSLLPVSGGHTIEPGAWKSFAVDRRPKDVKISGSEITVKDFSTPVHFVMSNLGVNLTSFFNKWFSVKHLDTGKPYDRNLDSGGFYSVEAWTVLKYQGSKKFKGP